MNCTESGMSQKNGQGSLSGGGTTSTPSGHSVPWRASRPTIFLAWRFSRNLSGRKGADGVLFAVWAVTTATTINMDQDTVHCQFCGQDHKLSELKKDDFRGPVVFYICTKCAPNRALVLQKPGEPAVRINYSAAGL